MTKSVLTCCELAAKGLSMVLSMDSICELLVDSTVDRKRILKITTILLFQRVKLYKSGIRVVGMWL